MDCSKLKQEIGWSWMLTKGFRWRIVLFVVLEVLAVAFSLGFVYWSKQAIDIAMRVTSGSLYLTLTLLVCSIAMSVVAGLAANWINEYIRVKMTIRLQNRLTGRQMMLAWQQEKRWRTGDLLVRIHTDCPDVTQLLSYSIPSLLVIAVKLFASLGFLWVMDPMLAVMLLFISPLFLFSKLYYKKMRALSQSVKQAESRYGIVLQENLKSRLLIRSLRLSAIREETLLQAQDAILDLKTDQMKFSAFTQGVLRITFNGGYLLAFIWGIYQLNVGLISFGTMTAFLQLVGRVQGPILSGITFIPAAIRTRASIERLIELNEEETEEELPPVALEHITALELKDVSFRYVDTNVIDHFSAVFRRGEPTAVIGASGKGKTTLNRLMLSLIRPDDGEINIYCATGRQPVSVATRSHFAYVPQGNSLFNGTIRENLLLVCPEADEEMLCRALNTACAEFVFTLPQGLETEIGESAVGLSEGQAQRIAIARSLLCDSAIWLFDEISSALDMETTKRLIKNLIEAGKDKIIIFVTHDHFLTEACPQIVKLR